MGWKKDLPIESGYYWYFEKHQYGVSKEIVEIEREEDTGELEIADRSVMTTPLEEYTGYWFGPLIVPPDPKF